MTRSDQYNIDNTKAQMRKGFLELPILLIIAHGDVYAADILSQLKSMDLIVVEGTLYPLLSRLRRSGIVDYEWRESESGPPRKYYILTTQGHEVLDSLRDSWKDLKNIITKLINQYEKSS